MRALLCESLDGPDGLVFRDVPKPAAGPGQVLVRVKFAALNFMDTLITRGKYQRKPELPFSPGAEFAGVVEGGDGFAPGARVMGWIGWGAAREMVAVPANRLVEIPDGVGDETAAGLAVTYGTAIHALQTRAAIRPGETLAVLGASGGAGLAAVEVGKLLGARVIACASSADKLAEAARHGADDGVNYENEDLKQALKALTGGRGVDVVYDPVGGALSEAALRATGWGGRYLVVGFASGEIPQIPANLLLVKGSSLVGVHWGSSEMDPLVTRAELAGLLAHVAAGRLSPQIHGIFPLAQAREAFAEIENRRAKGKVLLRL